MSLRSDDEIGDLIRGREGGREGTGKPCECSIDRERGEKKKGLLGQTGIKKKKGRRRSTKGCEADVQRKKFLATTYKPLFSPLYIQTK